MTNKEQKIATLAKIANLLNGENITWAVGASLLLYLKGLVEDFNDLDIMVLESDAEKAKALLLNIGSIKPSKVDSHYKTRFFYEFSIDTVDVDVIAGFVIVSKGKEYYCPLVAAQIVEKVTVNCQVIPLQSLVLWREYYQLMERKQKVDIIDSYLKQYSLN